MNFIKQPEKENYSKDFRAYREIDNFAENFITCSLTLQNDSNIFNKGICGLCYGGLELPIIMNLQIFYKILLLLLKNILLIIRHIM